MSGSWGFGAFLVRADWREAKERALLSLASFGADEPNQQQSAEKFLAAHSSLFHCK